VSCHRNDDNGVTIKVVDQGEGISRDDQSRIFEEFVQVSASQQVGTGLGLPISRRLATLLDGSLDVKSEPGKGSTFTLNLPAEVKMRDVDTGEFEAAKKPESDEKSRPQTEVHQGVPVA
jgi:signal transduction histidine kinase